MKLFLQKIAEGGTLTQEEAGAAMHSMMRGEAAPEEIAGLLMGLRARGETLDELTGFTRVMRAYAVPVRLEDPHAIDIVGTGGDGSGTFNISTAAALVCAGAGVTVAKHGNRSVSSKCGSADVLAALGIRTDLDAHGVERCLREAGIAFLFAPTFHPAVRHVMPVRRALGVRTFFNILGPLCNPAGVQRYLIGAFSRPVARQMIGILARLGATFALTVHADDGLDELSLAAPSTVFAYDARQAAGPDDIATWTVTPEAHGFERVPLTALAGADADTNAALIRAVLDGRPGPHRDVVLLNAAYALLASGRFASLEACFEAARESLDRGAARARLDALVDVSNAS
ncbi:MAG: anthranilate phosphoribosyltransferase [Rhodothermaceae bacterium]|nr:MAG: anthranilate phosphoribosyltransferase [Bacteroidota bacterium]GIV62505.1 MAG: anthranilate phosphoribosyltransferase [Rhodothermaceae bacterium]